jgi:cell division protease FtsH
MFKIKRKGNKKKKKQNNFLLLLLVALMITWGIVNADDFLNPPIEVSISEFQQDVRDGDVWEDEVTVLDDRIVYSISENEKRFTFKEKTALIQDVLQEEELSSLNVFVKPSNDIWGELAISFLPLLLMIGVLVFVLSKAQGANNKAISFGNSKARVHDKTKDKTTFKDVAGAEEAKDELEEVVDFLRSPKKYQKMGAKIPKGVLLVGPPGTGKTLLARAVAGEANVPFFSISGSEFVEMFVGVGASRVRDLFKKAKRNAPCIIFVDEIDAVGRKRGAGLGGGHDEREQTLNQILTEMDGFEQGSNVIVMAATNRPDVLDPALLRPGRFDRRVTVDKPGIDDREKILNVHASNKPLSKSVDLKTVAKQTPGMTGADLENIMNEAAIYSAKRDRKTITQKALEESVEKVALGPERKSRVMTAKEKKITSYHEVGHALVGHMLSECDPVHKVSVVSRGMALGVTWSLPQDDLNMYSRTKFEHKLASLMGGYVAEEVFFGETSTGPSNDLQRATNIAKRMVMEFGMSELGPVTFGEKEHEVFLGKDMAHTKNYSEAMAEKIDALINEILNNAYLQAKELITKYKDLMVEISEDLLVKENLSRDEFLGYFEKAGVEAPLPNN